MRQQSPPTRGSDVKEDESMATILRDWSYRYQWVYDGIAWLAALAVGGESRFRQLALKDLPIRLDSTVLDLCCGSGQSTRFLLQYSHQVTGLDVSLQSLQRAHKNIPQATYIEGFAETLPFPDASFDFVHTSVALHEMEPHQLQTILQEVFRVLKPDGFFTAIDLHAPTNPLLWPGIALFLVLFETKTAWQLLHTDLPQLFFQVGFRSIHQPSPSEIPKLQLYGGGSIQVIQAQK